MLPSLYTQTPSICSQRRHQGEVAVWACVVRHKEGGGGIKLGIGGQNVLPFSICRAAYLLFYLSLVHTTTSHLSSSSILPLTQMILYLLLTYRCIISYYISYSPSQLIYCIHSVCLCLSYSFYLCTLIIYSVIIFQLQTSPSFLPLSGPPVSLPPLTLWCPTAPIGAVSGLKTPTLK